MKDRFFISLVLECLVSLILSSLAISIALHEALDLIDGIMSFYPDHDRLLTIMSSLHELSAVFNNIKMPVSTMIIHDLFAMKLPFINPQLTYLNHQSICKV